MAPRNLALEEMAALSEAWLDGERHRPVLESIPILSAMIPYIDGTHRKLIDAQRHEVGARAREELTRVRTAEVAVDDAHDRCGRGGYMVLQGLESLAESEEEAAHYRAIRQRLYPDDLTVLARDYITESSNAERVARELRDRRLRADLDAIPLPNRRTLAQVVDAFVDAGRRLGHLETRKAALVNAIQDSNEGEDGARDEVVSARNQWCQMAQLFLLNAGIVRGEDAARLAAVLAEFRAVEARADQRAARRRRVEGEGEAAGVSGSSGPV